MKAGAQSSETFSQAGGNIFLKLYAGGIALQ